MDAVAAFMPLSFMVNGSVINLETQRLPEKNMSTVIVKDRMSIFDIQQTLSQKKKRKKKLVNMNSYSQKKI